MSAERSSGRVGAIELTADSVEEADPAAEGTRAQPARVRRERDPEDPFGILVVGDFRGVGLGAPADDRPPLAERRAGMIDRDNFDRVLRELSPAVQVLVGEDELAVPLQFGDRHDFHPDRLLESAPHLKSLAEERERIESGESPAGDRGGRAGAASDDESTSGDTGAGGAGGDDPGDAGAGGRGPDDGGGAASAGGGLLDQVLSATPGGDEPAPGGGQSAPGGHDSAPERDRGTGGHAGESGRPRIPATASELDAFVRRAVEGHRVAAPDAGIEAALDTVDAERGRHLREVLHDPRFQTLEARWRALELLVHRLDTGTDLKVFVLQAGPGELRRAAADGTLDGWMARTADEHLAGASWSVVVLEHAFRATGDELEALHGLAGIGETQGCTLVAEADPSLLDPAAAGGNPLVAKWSTIRSHPGARRIGLVLPRFLVREPYAPGENPVDALEDFREFDEGSEVDPRQLLWGNAGHLIALHMGETFRRGGWATQPGARVRIGGLSIALHPGPDGVEPLPSTEIELDGAAIQELAGAGFIGVGGRPGEGTVGMPAVRSLGADGPPWG